MSADALQRSLLEYLRAHSTDDRHALRARRTRVLPELRSHEASIQARLPLVAAIRLLDDRLEANDSAEDAALRARLSGRLETLSPDRQRMPVLLLDQRAGGARVAELVVEISDRPGAGRVDAACPADPQAEAAAEAGVRAACSLLRSLGWAAEPGDLEIAWQVPGPGRIEGPSLGLPLALAVLSRVSGRPLPPSTSATGQVELDGRVAPVAGIAEKLAAAQAAGIDRVLTPPGAHPHPVGELAEAAAALLDLKPRVRPARRALLVATIALACALGLYDLAEPTAYVAAFQPLPSEALSPAVVLVPYDRSNSGATPTDVPPVDFAGFADHRSYRRTHAVVLDRLVAAGARAVAIDAWIAGGEREATAALAEAVRRATDAGVPVILPARHDGGRWDPPDTALLEAGARVGFGSALAEGAGQLVRAARLAHRPGEQGPAWSVPLLLAGGGVEPSWTGAERLRAGGLEAEAPGGRWLIPYPAQAGWRRLPYADVYAGRLDPAHLADALVLIGSTQGDGDQHRTPVGRWYGVEVQAAVVDGLLAHRRIGSVSRLARAAWAGLAAALLLAGLPRLGRALRSRPTAVQRAAPFLAALALSAVALVLSRALLAQGLWWPWSDAAVALLVAAVAGALAPMSRQMGR